MQAIDLDLSEIKTNLNMELKAKKKYIIHVEMDLEALRETYDWERLARERDMATNRAEEERLRIEIDQLERDIIKLQKKLEE